MRLIPNDLLRAHEDGEVVFFCGAGVSQSVGLPDFKCLVRKVLTDLLPAQEACPAGDTASLAWDAFRRNDYDDALGLLESPKLGTFDPKKVREQIRTYLSTKVEEPTAHKALIRLSGLDRAKGRLVTTNFDRLFETAHESLRGGQPHMPPLDPYVAPALPPAKPDAFRGLLYLHGRLDPKRTDDDKNLVLTKSDFGSAYMLDGWARRFIVDLFRHYHVVFVGYSVEDPTMRYLVSAMAAVREEAPTLFRTAYSFAPYRASSDGADKQRTELTWRSRGLRPILYDDAAKHAELWDSVQAWADQHQGGLTAHKQTVVRLSQVTLAGKQDNRIDEMTWALTKPEVAKYFADRDKDARPDPGWIAPLQKRGLLSRSVYRADDPDSPTAPLASRQLSDSVSPDDMTAHLALWIARCLDDRRTVKWAILEGAVLHATLRRTIRWALADSQPELPIVLRKIWRVLSSDDYAASLSRMNANNRSSLSLCKGLGVDEFFARNTLLHCLRPVPVFQVREPGFIGTNNKYRDDPSQWYKMDLALEGINHKGDIAEIKQAASDWKGALAAMADELTGLLKEAMDWFKEFRQADAHYDLTHIHYRSFSPHEQNDITPIWTELIGLCRDAHDALVASAKFAAAQKLVDQWRSLPYPVFRRLALHAATNPLVNTDLGLDLLLGDKHPTLWDPCAQRETLRFLRKRGVDIQEERLDLLLRETLRGPPREPYRESLTDDKWNRLRDNEIRLRLAKLTESGADLSKDAIDLYESLPEGEAVRPRSGGSHPEEFGTFISFGWGGIPGFEDPVTVGELENWPIGKFVEWAQAHEDQISTLGTPWEGFVRRDRAAAAHRLREAGGHDCWPRGLWSRLLYVLEDGDDDGDKDALQAVNTGLLQMPVKALAEISVEASRWLRSNRESLEANAILQVWRKIWDASQFSDDAGQDELADLQRSLNHAGGILGEVLYAELADDIPSVGARQNPGVPSRLREEFALMGEGDSLSCRLARVSMAVRLVELYRIDPTWTDKALLRRMGGEPGECVVEIGLWEGYFAGRQCSEDLLNAFKRRLLAVLDQVRQRLPNAWRGAVHHFTHLAVWENRGLSRDEAKSVFWEWDDTSLAEAAWVTADVLRGADDRSDVLWKELIGPWFKHVWPGREQDKTPAVSAALCRIALAVDTTFPDVVKTIRDFLIPGLQDNTLHRLSTAKVSAKFPEDTLRLLDKIFGDAEDEHSTGIARRLIKEAIEAEPTLRQNPEFERLRGLLGMDPASEPD